MAYYAIVRNDDYISHHGVKGQKWGIRRYQNYDGTWKKNAKSIKKLAKKTTDAKTFENELHSKVQSIISDDQKKRVNAAKDKWLSTDDDYDEAFEKSKEAKQMDKETHIKVMNDLKEFNPELHAIIKKENGSRDPDGYHDYRKLWDGWADDLSVKYHKQFDQNHPEIAKHKGDHEKAYNNYINECKKVTDEIIGKYGNIKAKSTGSKLSDHVQNAVQGYKVYQNTTGKVMSYDRHNKLDKAGNRAFNVGSVGLLAAAAKAGYFDKSSKGFLVSAGMAAVSGGSLVLSKILHNKAAKYYSENRR